MATIRAKDIGENIDRLLYIKGITVHQFAIKSGISPTMARKYIDGTLCPRLKTLLKMSDALGVELKDLIQSNTENNL